MPTVQVTLSRQLDRADKKHLALALSSATASILSTPEAYVQVVISDEAIMTFGGEMVDDSAFVRVYSIGEFTPAASRKLSAEYAVIFEAAGCPRGHLYINFSAQTGANWGCNGTTFG